MNVKKLDSATFEAWVEACVQKHRVFGVQAKGDRFAFEPLARARDLRLDYDVTILPPKKYFQPPREVLCTFRRDAAYESRIETDPFVVFGIHPYDLAAILQMDAVFAADHADVHYLARRASATLVAVDVENPSANVFAGCMNTATVEQGFDMLLTKVDGGYLADARTAKGEALLALADGAAGASRDDLARREKVWERNRSELRRHELKPALAELSALLGNSYEHPVWEEKAQLCYSCGSCNLVCPTCYCFDVQDDVDWSLAKGERSRAWDGCMLADFASVAGGHNFRRHRADRYRHRYYRKGKYVPDKFGQVACVGCGRCITACTAKIANPVEIYNRLLEEK
ncbi:MAG: 4Fe-4S dicluster domain-containing protein [Kiritimatiellae bacterium]|nr:4Fe-4S dicluster domain-containing protein [Kiritimatiellia bacterium]